MLQQITASLVAYNSAYFSLGGSGAPSGRWRSSRCWQNPIPSRGLHHDPLPCLVQHVALSPVAHRLTVLSSVFTASSPRFCFLLPPSDIRLSALLNSASVDPWLSLLSVSNLLHFSVAGHMFTFCFPLHNL